MKSTSILVKQRGASLVEVLVSLTIGLVILTAIGTVYVNSTNMTRQREDQAQLNDPATIVMRMLRSNLQMAGYVDIFDLDAANRSRAASLFVPGNPALTNMFVRDPNPAIGTLTAPLSILFPGLTPVFGCDGAMTGSPFNIADVGPPANQTCGAASATRHSLQVAYQAVPLAAVNPVSSLTATNTNTGEGLDCLQQTPQAGVSVVINRFTAPAPAAGNVSQWRCAGSGANQTQDIAPGVEEFVLRYQMSAPGVAAARTAAGGSQSQYLSATQVAASAQSWAGVTAIEVCIVSATPVTSGPAAQGTIVLQTARPTCQRDANGGFLANIPRAAGDTRLWKRFTSVMAVRNAVYATPF